MAAVHTFLLLASGRSAHSHAAGGPAAGGPDSSAAATLLVIIALELTTALLASALVARLRTRGWRELARNDLKFEICGH